MCCTYACCRVSIRVSFLLLSFSVFLFLCPPFPWDSIFKMHLHSALINDIRTVFNVHWNRINILLAVVSVVLSFNAYAVAVPCKNWMHSAHILCALRFMRYTYINNSTQQVWAGKHAPSRLFGLPYCHCLDFWGSNSFLDFLDGFLYCIRYLSLRSNLLKIFLQQWISNKRSFSEFDGKGPKCECSQCEHSTELVR